MKVPADEVLQPAPASEDMDPVSETVAAAMGRPVYVLPQQDHVAHLQTHLAFLKSPMFGSNPAITKTYLYPIAQHLRDHLLNYYLVEAHNAVDQAQREKLIPEEAEAQVGVIIKVQQFIEQQLGEEFATQLAQIDEMAQKFRPEPPMPPDNSMQVAQINAQVRGQDMQMRAQIDTILPMDEQDFGLRSEITSAMGYAELTEFIEAQRLGGSGRVAEFEVELYNRTASPFSIFVLTLIGVSVASRKQRGGIGAHLMVAVIIGFVFVFVSRMTTVSAMNLGFPAWLAVWVPNVLFMGIGAWLYSRAQK
jgi:hypothetical protein